MGIWTHIAMKWNRSSKLVILLINNIVYRRYYSTSRDINANPTNHPFYEVGIKKDTAERFHGYLRNLVVASRWLGISEMLQLVCE